ncbi:MAG: alpha/beta fold hydrolase [Xanthobacteraceae bacterium]|nr:alpha/beta fold hydrolase [Xanthobacteraceae bacterium]
MLFQFENFTLDAGRRELREGAAEIPVEPQVFDLLEFLIRRRDEVVSRDDLIEHVWKGRIVSESAMASRINAARVAVRDNGTDQRLIRTIARKGIRFVGEVREQAGVAQASAARGGESERQEITFARAADGVNIAIGRSGDGPVLLKTANWLNHLEFDWQSPIWAPLFSRLAERLSLVRYDGRGSGLADRDVEDISLDGFLRDLDAVTVTIAEERFALLGLSQGVAAAISYTVKYPERVSKLILYGGYAQGRNKSGSALEREKGQAMLALMRQGWGSEGSAFMRAFSSIYLPNGTAEQIRWFSDMQRMATTAENAARLRSACDDIDVIALLPQVRVPTLVIHARQDNVVPYAQGRTIAAGIPGAKFVTLETENHVPLPGDPAWEKLVGEILSFAADA